MKNLGKTIDQLIQIDNNLEGFLKPIKSKWKRFPKRAENYWNELLTFLNTKELMVHPKREKMREVINSSKKRKRPVYSFEELTERDIVIGPITGKLADKVRRLDLQSIKIAKEHVEANMTHNAEKYISVVRKSNILDIETKKMWVSIRDHFNLWLKHGKYHFKICKENNIIYLVEQFIPPQVTNSGAIKMNPEMLKKFFNFLGIEPPPDLFGGKR